MIIWELAGGIEKDSLQKPQTERITVSEDREELGDGLGRTTLRLEHHHIDPRRCSVHSSCSHTVTARLIGMPSN